jgi:L-lactate dehydrogenase complex protein LldE
VEGGPRKVALFVTCVVDALAPDTGAAVVRLLRRRDIQVLFPEGQGCCGQPAWNSGLVREAAMVARPTLRALASALDRGAEAIVCPAGSCATMCRVYWPELFAAAGRAAEVDEARRVGERLLEFSELMARLPALPARPDGRRIALHFSCHMLRELGIRRQPALLAERAGCSIVPWAGAERCCGFGGTFSVKLPELSVAMAEEKLQELDDLAPQLLVGCDTSCLLHLAGRARARGRPLATAHLAELLDKAEAAHG